MDAAEAAAFEASPAKAVILAMRTWDEAAKVPGAVVPPVESYAELLARVVRAHAARDDTRAVCTSLRSD